MTAQYITIIHQILWLKWHRKYFVDRSTISPVKIELNLKYKEPRP
ncbi:hypothetical protein NIES4071_37950 [Calothrix sp. NIES-4071]|nr:hypothetical protein NIES4071_37950 [Calothrix sp. NIES-4071]BAZ58112.1 hypothetical protein NIES4105_37880 [Calothrix sp. NIES-4105]